MNFMTHRWIKGPGTYTEAANLRWPPLKTILQWVIAAWRELDRDIIINSNDLVNRKSERVSKCRK